MIYNPITKSEVIYSVPLEEIHKIDLDTIGENIITTSNNIKPIYNFISAVAKKTDDLSNKIINFSCVLNNKKYFLSNKMISECKNNVNFTPDCENTVLILIDENTIQNELNNYINMLEINDVKCQERLSNKNNCTQHRQFIHDFKLIYIGDKKNNKFVIRGTGIPMLSGKRYDTILNQALSQTYELDTICTNDYGYGLKKDENIYAEISLVQNDSSTELNNCIMKMQSYVVLRGISGKPAVRITHNHKYKIIDSYIAVDTDNKCNNDHRIKLVYDKNDKNILKFTVNIIEK